MIVLGIVLAVLVLIALLRVGAELEFGGDGVFLKAFAGLISIKLLPKKVLSPEEETRQKDKKAAKKAKSAEKKRRKQEKKRARAEKRRLKAGKKRKKTAKPDKEGEQTPEKKGGTLQFILSLLPSVKEVLGRFRRRLLIKRLTIWYTSAGEDPYSTAMTFGYVSAGMGILTPFFKNNFRVRKCDFRTNFDFDAKEPYVYINARLSLAIWELIYIILGVDLKTLIQNMPQGGHKTNTDDQEEDRDIQ